jgi:hypothetical protein
VKNKQATHQTKPQDNTQDLDNFVETNKKISTLQKQSRPPLTPSAHSAQVHSLPLPKVKNAR